MDGVKSLGAFSIKIEAATAALTWDAEPGFISDELAMTILLKRIATNAIRSTDKRTLRRSLFIIEPLITTYQDMVAFNSKMFKITLKSQDRSVWLRGPGSRLFASSRTSSSSSGPSRCWTQGTPSPRSAEAIRAIARSRARAVRRPRPRARASRGSTRPAPAQQCASRRRRGRGAPRRAPRRR
jgi:hypothetical protein